MKDLLDELAAAHRAVSRRTSDGTEEIAVLIQRSYRAPIEDVWDAVTDPDRLERWFLPVAGELRPGGTFQLEGNAGGEIRRCDAPRHLTVTWGGPTSVVNLRLSSDGQDATVLELEHTVPVDIAGSGAGALYVGPGWDISILALGNFLRGVVVEGPAAWENSLEGQRFSERTISAWADVVGQGDTATADEICAAAAVARAQSIPDLVASRGEAAGD